MEYKYIINPVTNRKCSINNTLGKKILKNYINIQHGGVLDINVKEFLEDNWDRNTQQNFNIQLLNIINNGTMRTYKQTLEALESQFARYKHVFYYKTQGTGIYDKLINFTKYKIDKLELNDFHKNHLKLITSMYFLKRAQLWQIRQNGQIVAYVTLPLESKLNICSKLLSYTPNTPNGIFNTYCRDTLYGYLDNYLFVKHINEIRLTFREGQNGMIFFENAMGAPSASNASKLHVLFNSNLKMIGNLYFEALKIFLDFFNKKEIRDNCIGKINYSRIHSSSKKGKYLKDIWYIFNGRAMADIVIYPKANSALEIKTLLSIGEKLREHFNTHWKHKEKYFDTVGLKYNVSIDDSLKKDDGKYFLQYTTGTAGDQKAICEDWITDINMKCPCRKDKNYYKKDIILNLSETDIENTGMQEVAGIIQNNTILYKYPDLDSHKYSIPSNINVLTYKNPLKEEDIKGLKPNREYIIKKLKGFPQRKQKPSTSPFPSPSYNIDQFQLLDKKTRELVKIEMPKIPGKNYVLSFDVLLTLFDTQGKFQKSQHNCKERPRGRYREDICNLTLPKELEYNKSYRVDCNLLSDDDKKKYKGACIKMKDGKYIGKILKSKCYFDRGLDMNIEICDDPLCMLHSRLY